MSVELFVSSKNWELIATSVIRIIPRCIGNGSKPPTREVCMDLSPSMIPVTVRPASQDWNRKSEFESQNWTTKCESESQRFTDPWQRFAGSHKIEELFLPIAMILAIQTAGLRTYPESPVLPWNQLTPWHFFKNLVTEVFLFCKFSQTQTGGYNKIKEPPQHWSWP